MIIDKKHAVSTKYETVPDAQLNEDDNGNVTIEDVELNPIKEIYNAVKRVLSSIHTDPNDESSPLLFHTIKVDNGQFERIVKSKENTEYGIAFPAVFVRFVNVRYLVAQQRIGEGRATMRIRYVLNDLNNSDDDMETHGFEVFQYINDAIQDAKDVEPALNERCNLTYFDMPQSLDNGLQPYWIDYEVWFRQTSSFQYRKWVDRYLVIPPFTNHSDAPEHDYDHHGDHETPSYDEVSGFSEPYNPDSEDDDTQPSE